METETIKSVVDLLASGGNAALIMLVYVAFRTLEFVRGAAAQLKAMSEAVATVAPKVDKIGQDVRDIASDMESVDDRLGRQELQLAAALNRPYPIRQQGQTGT